MNKKVSFKRPGDPLDEGEVAGMLVGSTDAGAFPVGSKVIKVNFEEGDATPEGTRGTVLSSTLIPADLVDTLSEEDQKVLENCRYYYVIDWESSPGYPVHTLDKKVALDSTN